MRRLNQLADLWSSRSARERTLALAVAGLVLALMALLGVRGAMRTIAQLDSEINRLQSDIVNHSYQIARRQAVDQRYQAVAAQHSSAWTESEIRDRLRQEIYRLRYRMPPRLDANGIPLSTESDGETLVSIPELRGGHLVDGGEGFREYRIDFDIPPVPFPDLLAYLEYLQDSPQSLRIDHIDLRRDPQRPEIAARIGLARIVVDDLGSGTLPASDQEAALPLRAEDWTLTGGAALLSEEDQYSPVLEFRSSANRGEASLRRTLAAPGAYELQVELAATAPVTLGVHMDPAAEASAGSAQVPGDGHFYRCRLAFRTPEGGAAPTVEAPVITWDTEGATVRLRRLQITAAGEGAHGS